MNIVIIGSGAVGETLVGFICREGHSVTVIDEDPDIVDAAVNTYDIMGIIGNGSSIDIQKEAGIPTCDLVIAVSPGDEMNLLCCMIARKLGAKHSIARVRDPEYLNQTRFMCTQLGIDMIVNPEYEAARETARLVRFPAATKIEKFFQGQVEVLEIHIGDMHPLIGTQLKDFKQKFNTNALICAVRRNEETLIPSGDFIISCGDTISITAQRRDMADLFMKFSLGNKQPRIKNVMILGGGRISRYLASAICNEFSVTIVENDLELCEELASTLPKADIIHGDPTDTDLLIEEGIDNMGACITMTDDNKANIIIAMFAKTRNVKKVITYIPASLQKLTNSAGLDSNITPKSLVVAKVLGYIRGLDNAGAKGSKSAIKALYKMCDNTAEALQFDVAEDFDMLSVPLKDIKIRKNTLIAAIIRDGNVTYPHGNSTMEIGDSVIVVTTNEKMYDLGDILA